MSKDSAVVSRNQAFTRFLPGAIETIDGETVKVSRHALRADEFDNQTRQYLRHQLRSAIEHWPYRDAVFKAFIADPDDKGFQFVTSVEVIANTLATVECKQCKAVFSLKKERLADKRCPRCHSGLRVLPFIEVHSCGEDSLVRVPQCGKGHGDRYIKLERHAQQRWVCGEDNCDWAQSAFTTECGPNCYFKMLGVVIDRKKRRKSQILVGSNSAFRSHSIDILNPPQGDVVRLFKSYSEFVPTLFIADYLGIQHVDFKDLEPVFQMLNEIREQAKAPQPSGPSLEEMLASMGLSADQQKAILEKTAHAPGQMHTAKRLAALKAGFERTQDIVPELAQPESMPYHLVKQVQDLRLAVNLPNSATLSDLIARLSGRKGPAGLSALELKDVRDSLSRYGLEDIALVSNFPIVSCAYGFTRGPGYSNDDRVLNAFPKCPPVAGGNVNRTPFYVLSTPTEALVVRIAPIAMMRYLAANDFISESEIPDDDAGRRAWILRKFMVEDRKTNPVAYAIFTAVHSYAHRMIENVALESCFSTTSLSEMVMPASLSFAVYVNQRSEFNIGGLSSFVEQRLSRALAAIVQSIPCMFDPICTMKDGGACNGCLFLPEVTCREFNDGLTRSALHGGDVTAQHEIGKILGARHLVGFFEVCARAPVSP